MEAVMTEDRIIARALKVLEKRMRTDDAITSPQAARDYVRLKLGKKEHEVFAVVFLNAQNQVIGFVEMFRGTLTQTAVYPREVVKAALLANAAGVLLAHPHPSGVCEPSMADRALTQALKAALALVDISVLDHIIVAGPTSYSFAEHGIL
jgi:DNA repair protein RadC